jgi:hypothetical protein
MAGVYRPRHPERTVLYRVLFHYFDRFLAEYEGRFEKECGFFRPIIKAIGRALSGLRQPALRIRPHPLSGLWPGAAADVLLPHPRFLSLLPCQKT